MKTVPFTYGKITGPDDFTNRTTEIALLKRNFMAGINTILISPRRWGKSSLLHIAAQETVRENPEIRICPIDIFNLRNEHEFYMAMANGVLHATSSKWEEFVQNAKQFLSGLIPTITFSPDKQTGVSFGVSWEEVQRNPDEILDLAEKIAVRKNIKIVVCIDEFQSLTAFNEPLLFQKKLRSHWQNHRHVTYCLYGSKRHMLLDVFSNPSMPFYKFGELVYLKKIDTVEWVTFIQKRFTDTGKSINESDARLIAVLADNHAYYVQQLAQQTWFRTKKVCRQECVISAHEDITDQLSLLFSAITERLSAIQLGVLRAILSGEEQLTSQRTLSKYRLGTSANVVRVKRGLIESEVIDDTGQEINFLDPIYKYWLETFFFKINKTENS